VTPPILEAINPIVLYYDSIDDATSESAEKLHSNRLCGAHPQTRYAIAYFLWGTRMWLSIGLIL